MGRFLIVASLLAFLAAVVVFVVISWQQMGVVQMSGHGVTALIAGVVLSLVVGGGLMALVFISARRGYDDAADRRGSRSHKPDQQD
ncbi:MAG TPA: hypothetical protein VIG90_16455 [Pedomonas sp.]|uniref:hypothetical protein n=1 Tax=Pedomonas sp. TaxID=2976421 RepID=UPI002F3E9987